MQKSSLFKVILLLLAGGAAVAMAGENKYPAMPGTPLVAPVPDRADWTVSVESDLEESGESKSRPIVLEVHSTKIPDLKRDVVTFKNGTKGERWYVFSYLLWKTAQGDVVANDLAGGSGRSGEDGIPSVATGFAGTQWVAANHFEKLVLYKKRFCYHYINDGKEVWIDAETHLPFAYKIGNLVYRYKFNPPPNELSMPVEFQKVVEEIKPKENKLSQ